MDERDRQRLHAVERHPGFAAATQYRPSVDTTSYQLVTGAACAAGLVFAAVGAYLLFVIPWHLAAVWLSLALGFCVLAFRAFTSARRYARAPVLAVARLVVSTRTRVSTAGGGGGAIGQFGSESTAAMTAYFVTLEDSDGARRELRAPGVVLGTTAAGDVGVAYIKAEVLLGFLRFDVGDGSLPRDS